MPARSEFVGLDPDRWRRVRSLAEDLVGGRDLKAVVVAARHASAAASLPTPAISVGATAGDRFPVASLTKPVVAAVALRLCEDGRLSLADRVVDWLPAFAGGQRRPITVRHLLAHCSGLPDVWPENTQLRRALAGRGAFVEASCRCELAAKPGTTSIYSSVGFSLLGAVLEAAGGEDLPSLVRREVSEPLAMAGTSLGGGGEVVPVAYPPEHEASDSDWNSAYWRSLGAPWGGLLATAGDMLKFLGAFASGTLVSPASREAAWADQRGVFADLGGRPWGLGWRFAWPGHAASFGDLLPADAVGHYGATGTLMWHSRGRLAVILTTTPALTRPRPLQLLSNAVAAAFADG